MNSSICWYECIHPKSVHNYFYNISTDEVKWHLQLTEFQSENVRYLDSLGYVTGSNLIFYFAKVKASFKALKENELSIKPGELVIIRTANINGWCYAENLQNQKGYIPFAYVISIFPTTEYKPEWQEVISLRKTNTPKYRFYPSIRKDLVVAQRRSRLQAQNTKSIIQNSSNSVILAESTSLFDEKDTTQKEKIALLRKIFVYYSDYIRRNLSTIKPYEAWSFDGLYFMLYNSSRFSKLSRNSTFNEQFKQLIENLHISMKNVSSFIPLYCMSQRIESKLEGSNHPSFVFKENIEEFKSINPFYSSKLHENKPTTFHNHLERMESIKKNITDLRNTIFSNNFIHETQNELMYQKERETEIVLLTTLSSSTISHCIPDIHDYSFYDFVSMYFQRDKARFFHTASIDELASFTSKIPIHSLTLLDHSMIQDALEIERWILTILGIITDSFTTEKNETWGHLNSNDSTCLLKILFQLASRKDLLDEIFCFIVKETIDPPDPIIDIKAFEILFVLLHCYHPSYHFFNYLASYLYKRIHSHDEIAAIALASLFQLINPSFKPADVIELNDKLNTALEEIEKNEITSLPSSLLGCSIPELLLIEKTAEIFTSHAIPLTSSGFFNQKLPLKITEHFIDEKGLTYQYLHGITIQMRNMDQKVSKERVFWINPSFEKLVWQTRNHNHIYYIPVDSILNIMINQFEETQAIFITTSYNYCKSNMSSKSITTEQFTVILILPNIIETKRMHLFLTCLVEWKKQNTQQLLEEYEQFTEEEKVLYERCLFSHQVHSKCVPLNEHRQAQFIQLFTIKVKGQETHYYEGEERRRESSEIEKDYGTTVPYIFIHIVERLKELNAYNIRGVFRENGDTEERDHYLKLINEGHYECIDEITTVPLLTSIFKRLFYLMEEPLIPYSVYNEIMKSDTHDIESCNRLLSLLPRNAYDVLMFILNMLCCYLDHPSNSLSAKGFIICFAPALLRSQEMKDFETLNRESNISTDFLVTLLQDLHSNKKYTKGLFDS